MKDFNKSSVIYKATFPNGKVYVGQTYRRFVDRYEEHKYCTSRKEINYAVYKAFRKYGFENVRWEILEYDLSKESLNDREIYWIEKLNSFIGNENSNGYNSTKGGDSFLGYDNSSNIEINLKKSEIFYIKSKFKEGLSLIEISNLTKLSPYKILSVIRRKDSYSRQLKKEVVEKIKNMLCNENLTVEFIAMENKCSAGVVHDIKNLINYRDVLPELNSKITEVFESNKFKENIKVDKNTVMSIKIDLSLGYSVTETALRNGASYYAVKSIFTFKSYSKVLEHLNIEINKFKSVIRKGEPRRKVTEDVKIKVLELLNDNKSKDEILLILGISEYVFETCTKNYYSNGSVNNVS